MKRKNICRYSLCRSAPVAAVQALLHPHRRDEPAAEQTLPLPDRVPAAAPRHGAGHGAAAGVRLPGAGVRGGGAHPGHHAALLVRQLRPHIAREVGNTSYQLCKQLL